MKKSMPKITALCLCVILAIGGIATTAFALKQTAAEAADEKEEAIGESASDAAAFKDETVYVLANADGSVKKIIVSDWIKNTLKSAELSDKTQLTDTENVKGNETYTLNGENMRVWDADGNDIYYSGSIEKELPVDLAVSYKLDGNPVSPDELAGKSGRVTIRFDYKNKQYETVEIDGKKVKIYVPFAMLTGLILNDDVFTNVEVANGKLINDGSRTAVIGIAFPGLAENLAIAEDKLQIPDYVEISADANNFKLDMTVTLAANGIFNELDTKGLDSVSELTGSLDELTDAMRQLLDGSSELYGGLAELLDKSGELVKGIDELAAGAKALKSGAESLDAGAGELSDGAGKLTEGLNTLASNNDTLNGGAKQVFETLLSTANTQLAAAGIDIPTLTVENYAQVLNGVISSLDETAVYEQALEKVTAAVEAQRYTVTSEVTAAVKESVTAEVTAAVEAQVAAQVTEAVRNTVAEQVINAALHMDKSAYDAAVSAGRIDKTTQDAIEAAIDGQMQSEQVIAQIKAQTAAQMATETAAKAAKEHGLRWRPRRLRIPSTPR